MNNPLLNFKNRILFLFLSAFLFFSCTAFFPTEQEAGYPAIITSVIDGDTVTIRFNTDILPSGCNRTEKVRLIGINTPELTINPPEYYAKEARDFLNQYYLTPIIVKFDSVSDRRDRYGRLLAYIYDDTSFDSINWRILYYGYGYFYGLFAFEAEKMEEFKIAETDARINKRGLWNELYTEKN